MNEPDRETIQDFIPHIRPVELTPTEVEDKPVVTLQDPLHIVEEMLIMTPIAGLIVALFDGSRTVAQIAEVIQEQIKQSVPLEEIYSLAQQLDERHFMVSPAFTDFYRELVNDFRSAGRRPAFYAEKAYPADPDRLRELLGSFFTGENGPGAPFGEAKDEAPVRGLIAPHIDLRHGGPAFAKAYHALTESSPPDMFVILGTAHAGSDGMFVASAKTFETPLGDIETDVDFIERLNEHYGGELFEDEILHRAEHTIEYQLLFLQYLYGGRHPIKIVPILCSYSHEMSQDELAPEYAGRIEAFGKALKETIQKTQQKVCVIGSVDLAHLGPRYGDPEALSAEQLQLLEEQDRRTLELVASGDAEAFNANVIADNNNRRLCGYPCLHTMLQAGDFSGGELLCYEQAQVEDAGSVVSFTSMIFR